MTNLLRKKSWALLAIGILVPFGVHSWSPTGNRPTNTHGSIRNNNNDNDNNNNNDDVDDVADGQPHRAGPVPSRRQLLQRALATAASAAATPANAACLQGDTRPVCIGIYKVPQDEAFKNYISTPEQLRRFAPDLVYVPPTPTPESFGAALEVLRTQRAEAESIKQSVAAGNLEEAGVGVLGLIPKVTTSGKFVLEELETRVYRKFAAIRAEAVAEKAGGGGAEEAGGGNGYGNGYDENGYKVGTTAEELAIDMASSQMDYVTGFFGECDVVIGQGIRGELGVSAVAQLTILATLRDATGALDDFLVTASTLGAKI